MADDDESDEWDRMSLNSLKRELEVQKAKTESARDEATERIREGAESSSSGRSWLWIVGAIVIVIGVVGAILSTIPAVREWQFELVSGHFDAGPDFDAGPAPEIDAGVDTGPAPRMRPRMHQPMQTTMMDALDFEDDDDPLGGLD